MVLRGYGQMQCIMVCMDEGQQRVLGQTLAERGVDLAPEEFLSILADVVDSTDALTESERSFLVERGGVSPDSVGQASQAEARQRIAWSTVRADAQAARGLTTGEVAHKLGRAPANVRRSAARGELFAAGRTRAHEHVFPAWQFPDDRPLPGLRSVTAALPPDLHPLDVETFMTTRREPLGDRSPVEWLGHDGDAAPVVRLAEDLGRS